MGSANTESVNAVAAAEVLKEAVAPVEETQEEVKAEVPADVPASQDCSACGCCADKPAE